MQTTPKEEFQLKRSDSEWRERRATHNVSHLLHNMRAALFIDIVRQRRVVLSRQHRVDQVPLGQNEEHTTYRERIKTSRKDEGCPRVMLYEALTFSKGTSKSPLISVRARPDHSKKGKSRRREEREGEEERRQRELRRGARNKRRKKESTIQFGDQKLSCTRTRAGCLVTHVCSFSDRRNPFQAQEFGDS
jgi:hypothetical protein